MDITRYSDGLLVHGECIEFMRGLIKVGTRVDMILADLPYGTTRNKWDSVIDLEDLWECYRGLIKENGAILLTSQLPFDKVLGCSNPKMLRYEWIWRKEQGTGHLNARKMPMKNHENILVFYSKLPTYNPQFTKGTPYKASSSKVGITSENYGKQTEWTIDNPGVRYPLTVLDFPRDKNKLHPTQKPVALFEYLVKTYTNKGELVLDNVLGSGTTAVACRNSGRKWIGIEQNDKYIDIIKDRLAEDVAE